MSQIQSNSAPAAGFPSECRIGFDTIDVFSTCPQSNTGDPKTYLQQVIQVARWSESIGCRGILVYTDNSLVDPWMVSQVILGHTTSLCPLVAVQPIYMHPYTAAKQVATLGFLYGRRVYLNMLAGGFRTDLLALGDSTPHDERYARTVEYTTIIRQLLESPAGVSFEGTYYRVHNLRMFPPLPRPLWPGILISGSSEAGMAAAHAIGATAIKYPLAPHEEHGVGSDVEVSCGVRVGIVARPSTEQAWQVARERFPESREGQLTHQLATKVSDSAWHEQLSARTGDAAGENPYWLGPFHNYQTFCPYLVGSYERVAQEIASYIGLGYRTFVLDIPPTEEELEHTAIVFREALRV
ncbi:LLM class flavin-dependent oxidoreductase [Methylocaldum sp.]|uniref:LLM class flavin-dependent oxidoreductase n=1 Tax=Methylocaldum sp. TaxID=1969727 RepID=UPI002D3CBE0B|nr:LLM class flavin-dependent oxidoreductase [Methylocaldum sp.]HYE35745.1 LLM class flavin-dependent oxidoreductase [Methylocaldum sp.]